MQQMQLFYNQLMTQGENQVSALTWLRLLTQVSWEKLTEGRAYSWWNGWH